MLKKKDVARSDKAKEQRRTEILQCAMKLFIDKGFHVTTIDELAKEAGVAKGSVYSYFKSKEEILFSIAEYIMGDIAGLFIELDKREKSSIRKLEKLAEFTFKFYSEQLEVCRMLIKLWAYSDSAFRGKLADWTREQYSESRKLFIKIIKDGIRNREIRDNIPAEETAIMLLAMLDGLLVQWTYQPEIFDSKKCMEAFRDVFLKSIMFNEQRGA